MRVDVVVVGAGASGLRCARALTDAGLDVITFESRREIGGRIRSWRSADGATSVELGAQVVHGSHNPIHELVGAAELTRLPRDVAAHVVVGGALRPMGVLSRARRAPWLVQGALAMAPALDGLTVAEWLDALALDPPDYRATREWLRQHWAADPGELDARGAALAQRGDVFTDGEFSIAGGFARLAHVLADGLDVRCGDPVRAVRWSPSHVEATTDAGTTRAAALVLTAPPPVVAAGVPDIELPAAKRAAAAALRSGDGCCSVVTYDVLAPGSAVVFDVDGGCGFLRCWGGRPEVSVVAKAGAAATVRAAAGVPAALATALPWTARATVQDVALADWGHDPWSRGAFTHPAPGNGWAAAVWAEPIADTIFFAGESTMSGRMRPWVHAALASGLRAAEQVVNGWTR